jgi:hypothetical protein
MLTVTGPPERTAFRRLRPRQVQQWTGVGTQDLRFELAAPKGELKRTSM